MLIEHPASMDEAFKYRIQIVSSSVSAPSKYKGPVSPSIDRAWRDLFQGESKEKDCQ